MRQRLGLNRSALEGELERALVGVKVEDTSGRLRKWLNYQLATHESGSWYRLTASALFVFNGGVLVTVMLIPPRLRKQALSAWRAHATDVFR